MKTIVLVDPIRGGHHSTYLKFFAKTLLELGHEVIVLCPEPEEIGQWIASTSKLSSRFEVFEQHYPAPSKFPMRRFHSTLTAIGLWQQTARNIQKISSKLNKTPDLAFFAWLDCYLGAYLTPAIVDRLFPYKWSGLYFHPRSLRIKLKYPLVRRAFLNPLSVLNSKHCSVVAVLDEGIADRLERKIDKPVLVFPDFADESPPESNFELVKEITAKASGRKIISSLGSLEKRKGFLTLLETSARLSDSWFFVFAGQLARDSFTSTELAKIQTSVAANRDNCFFHFERIPTESQFNALVKISDFLFVAYENFPHSSNLLTKAALFEKLAIAGKDFCIGDRVRKFNLGYTIEEGNAAQCVEVLKTIARQPSSDFMQPNFDTYKSLHSVDRLYPAFQNLLKII